MTLDPEYYPVYCLRCHTKNPFYTSSTKIIVKKNDISFKYLETKAHCCVCNAPVYVPWVNDMNTELREQAYAMAKKVAKEEQVVEDKYAAVVD